MSNKTYENNKKKCSKKEDNFFYLHKFSLENPIKISFE